jgi:hypothetical protein
MNPPAARGSITPEKSAMLEPINSEMIVPKTANSADKKLKNNALPLLKPA